MLAGGACPAGRPRLIIIMAGKASRRHSGRRLREESEWARRFGSEVCARFSRMLFDSRPTLSRAEARSVYDGFAVKGHAGGRDASSGYGGPAVQALLAMAAFAEARSVVDYGCGQGKLAELVLSSQPELRWRGVDQSPMMVGKASARLERFGPRCTIELLPDGDPASLAVPADGGADRFVSTYCLDLMSEADMIATLDKAEACLHPERGLLLLAGITWGYRMSVRT